MDTKDHPVIVVLGDQKRFMVPIYQREYRWRGALLTPFWEDVVAKAEELLDGVPKFKHYMGALIIAPGVDGYTVGATPKVQVVDGQQRLTTFQIFLAALREVAGRLQVPEAAESVRNYLFNPTMTGDKDDNARFKLVPTPEDRALFHDIIELGWAKIRDKHPKYFYQNLNLKTGAAPNALRAFDFFIKTIEDYAKFGRYDPDTETRRPVDDPATQRRRIEALLEALLNQLKLVVITLGENDDAQVIFETLNSKNEPLLAMDLVRNNIFHRAEAQGESAEELFASRWKALGGDFWKADSPRAKPRRPRIDHFLSHALTAQTGEETSLRELYAEYRAFSRPQGNPRFATVQAELDALLQFAPVYRALESFEGEPDLTGLGRKLATWEVSTAYPLVFCVAASSADYDVKASIYKLIYSYIVRRALCGLPSKNFNKNFQRMVATLLRQGVSLAAFAGTFAEQTGVNVRFPDDDEVRRSVRTTNLYTALRSERLQDILWEIELRLRTRYTVNTPRPDLMSIEHVLPRTWTTHWPLPDGRVAPGDRMTGADEQMLKAIAERDATLHTLGNLTLVTGPANTGASNLAFAEKKAWLKKSLLALNLEIDEHAAWDERAIADRGQRLANIAIQIWPALPSPEPQRLTSDVSP